MLALAYDIHGNLPALQAALDDGRARGATRWLLGGDMVAFGAWPDETLGRLHELERTTWIRGNTERWLLDRSDLPAEHPLSAALTVCREALGDVRSEALALLPESARVGKRSAAWHGSPLSDMRSFAPETSEDDAELLAGVADGRLFFGHTHLQFMRPASAGTVELVNPGSVGLPLDGDPRAAYALVHDDGQVELRRVAYDHAGSARALRERFGDADWVGIVAGRIEHAQATEA